MGGKIFVNYRRDENAERALAIASYLEREFGSSGVFLDIDCLRAGQNFPKELEKRLAACDVMLTLIGPSWLEVRNEAGIRRLDDPQDWVRLEIEHALARKIIVIPVLTGGASLPKSADLPDALKPLMERQAAVLTTSSFRTDMAGLVRDMREIMGGTRWSLVAAAAGALLLAAIGIIAIGPKGMPLPPHQPAADKSQLTNVDPEPGRKATGDKKRAETLTPKSDDFGGGATSHIDVWKGGAYTNDYNGGGFTNDYKGGTLTNEWETAGDSRGWSQTTDDNNWGDIRGGDQTVPDPNCKKKPSVRATGTPPGNANCRGAP